jgi:hypothetical protein
LTGGAGVRLAAARRGAACVAWRGVCAVSRRVCQRGSTKPGPA